VDGGQKLAMRLWLDAEKLAGRGLTATDVSNAVRRNNYQAAPGQVRGQYVLADVQVNSDLTSVEEFADMVIRNDGNDLVRLRDVGTVELGAAATQTSGSMNGEPAVYLSIFPTPKGNPLVIVDGIHQRMPDIQKTLPPGVKMEMVYECARFIDASIREVVKALLEAVVIVVLVIYLCLGSLRTVIIPVTTIPLAMLGAAALMLTFGFSIRFLLRLAQRTALVLCFCRVFCPKTGSHFSENALAVVLAIGLVVDDAIVVVENVHRHIEEGNSPVAAALIGAREITRPVIAMMLTLATVYAPIGMGGRPVPYFVNLP